MRSLLGRTAGLAVRALGAAPRMHARVPAPARALCAEPTDRPGETAAATEVTDTPVRAKTADVAAAQVEDTAEVPVPELLVSTDDMGHAEGEENAFEAEGAAMRPGADAENQKPKGMTWDPADFAAHLKELVARGSGQAALWQYTRAIRAEGAPTVNLDGICAVLPLLGRNAWYETARETMELIAERNYVVDTSLLNCGLHAMAKSGNHQAMQDVIEGMWAGPKSSRPNATTYNCLISAHVYRGMVDDAFAVLNDMKTHLIYPTFATYHALITGCLRRKDSLRAYETLLAVEQQRFDVSAMTVAQVMVACAHDDESDRVLHLMGKFEDSLPGYSIQIHRIAEKRSLYRMTNNARSSAEERNVLRGSPKLELGAISAILHCAYRNGRVDLASHAWKMLRKSYPDYEIPASMWYCLIGALSKSGDFSSAMDAVALMREQGISVSLRDLEASLTVPLSADVDKIDEQFFRLADRAGDSKPALEDKPSLVDDSLPGGSMIATDVSAPDETDSAAKNLTAVMDAETANADPAPVIEDAGGASGAADKSLASVLSEAPVDSVTFAEMSGLDAPQSVGINELNCIIAACSAAGDLDRAFQTYDEVESRFGLERNSDTFNALLQGCVETRHVKGGMRILDEMERVGAAIGSDTIHLIARLQLRNGHPEIALDIMKRAVQKGDIVSVQTYQMLVRVYIRDSEVEKAVEVIELAKSQGWSHTAVTARVDMRFIHLLPVDPDAIQRERRRPSSGPEGGLGRRANERHDAADDPGDSPSTIDSSATDASPGTDASLETEHGVVGEAQFVSAVSEEPDVAVDEHAESSNSADAVTAKESADAAPTDVLTGTAVKAAS